MKKIIGITLTVTLLLTANTAFAKGSEQSRTTAEGKQKTVLQNDTKDIRTQSAQKILFISQQQTDIQTLRLKLSNQINQTKNKLEFLRRNKQNLNNQKINVLKNTLTSINNALVILQNTQGSVQIKSEKINSARKNNQPDSFLTLLDEIAQIQQQRITVLNNMLKDLENLNTLL